MSAFSDEIRRSFKESDDKRDAGLSTPEGIVRFDDICYGSDKTWQLLDLYRPKGTEGKRLPVIVSVHGGGWVYGDKERYQYYCMDLALRGFAVVNFTYRLAPEHKFPAAIEDTNLVMTWVRAHADEYWLDTDNLFAVGDSAGAHNLGLYASICTNSAYAKNYSFAPPEGLKLKAVALNCGCYDVFNGAEADVMTRTLMADYLPCGGSEEEKSLITLTKHITSAFPPVFLMTACRDFLKAQAQLLAAKLCEKDVPFVYRYYVDEEHSLGHVFHCDLRQPYAALCNDEECAFFASLNSSAATCRSGSKSRTQ